MAITADGYNLGGSHYTTVGGLEHRIYNLKLDGSSTTFLTGMSRVVDARIGALYWDASGSTIERKEDNSRTIALTSVTEPSTGEGYSKLTFTLYGQADGDEILVEVLGR